MPQVNGFDQGVPSWVDLGAPELAGATAFYAELFGWTLEDMGEAAGHYTMASKSGRLVAGVGPAVDPGPPHWTVYVNVADVDKVAAAATGSGGQVVAGPTDVMTAGRMTVLADSTGAVVSAWQPGDHRGAELVDEAGAFIWSELATSDLDASKSFYTAVFGWGWGGSPTYAEAQVGGRTIAGVMPRPASLPEEVPDNWLVYFGANEVAEDTKRAVALGGTVLVEPTDIPGMGRFSVLADSQGAAFGLYRP